MPAIPPGQATVGRQLRLKAGLGDEPLGEVIPHQVGLMGKAEAVVHKVTP